MFSEKRSFKNANRLTISAVYEGESKSNPIVILCHGYGSGKDHKSTMLLTKKLLIKGLSVYRFDFTGCGDSEGKLKDLSPNQGIDDLKSAVKNLGKSKFGLYGSSFGGYIALILAAKKQVLALGLRAPVIDYPEVINMQGNEKEERAKDFLDQALKINNYNGAKKIIAPTLIVHGAKDDTVPISQSKKLIKSLKEEKKLISLPHATHDLKKIEIEKATDLFAKFFASKLL